jgi:DNA-binding SARP family transcriptional activator
MLYTEDLEFAVLGPLEVRRGSCRVPVRGWRERTVLAVLLLDADDVTSIDRLVEAVWEDDPPHEAVKAVRNCVSALRRRFAEAGGRALPIQAEPSGYRLRLDGCRMDARDFQQRVDSGRQFAAAGQLEEAAVTLRAALGLWRGPALAGTKGMVVEAGAARLNEERLAALEECLELELALGRHRQVVSELQALASECPLRERLAGQLMLALYRSGRQAEALDAYHRLAARLDDELGLNPGGEINRLHEAVLRQDSRLDLGEAASIQDRRPAGQPELEAVHVESPDSGQAYPLPAPKLSPGEVNPAPRSARLRRQRRLAVAGLAALALAGAAAGSLYLTRPDGHRAAAARDGTDPYADGCGTDQKAVAWEPVKWPGGRPYGTLTLYFSPSCQAAWGYLSGPNSSSWTIHIVPERPSSHASAPWQFSGNTRPGSWSNVLSTEPGCVYVKAFITTGTEVGSQATTPCFTGSGPVADTRQNP